MRPQTAICSALLFGGALYGAGLHAGDRVFGTPSSSRSVLPVMIPRQAAEEVPSTAAAPAFDAPVIRAQLTQSDAAPVADRSTAPESLRHCSVVGAVRMPGTYTGTGDSVLLRSLIDHAGGLTKQASGVVRILHGGRQQNVNLASSLGAVVIPPNSVIVVESVAAGPHAAEPGASPYIDVACLHLCERPVVLCLDPADASVPKILSLLGQPPELASYVRVLAPQAAHRLPSQTLVSGSVVVFDPAAVDRAALAGVLSRWPLQDVVEIPTSEQSHVASNAIDLYQFLEGAATPAQQIDLTSADSETSSDDVPAGALFAPTGIDAAIIEEEPALTEPVPLVEEPATGTPQLLAAPGDRGVHRASAVQLRSPSGPRTLPRELPATTESSRSTFESTTEPMTDAGLVMEPLPAADEVLPAASSANSHWARFGSSFAAWLLCGLAGYGVFRVWMRQHERRPRPVTPPADDDRAVQPAVMRDLKTPLSQLIDNSLPFREEETPALAQTFHGRTVGFRYLIRSGPHPLQGPHFAVSRTAPDIAPPAAAPAASVVQRTERGTFRFDTAVETAAEVADRGPVVATQSGGRGVSPLERALRSVLREGRDSAP